MAHVRRLEVESRAPKRAHKGEDQEGVLGFKLLPDNNFELTVECSKEGLGVGLGWTKDQKVCFLVFCIFHT